MKRTAATALLVITVLSAGAATMCETARALLGQMVPWPMMSTGIVGKRLEAHEDPIEALVLPDLPSPTGFGLMALGRGSDAGVACAMWERPDGPPLLLVDVYNNEDLTDDPWCEYDERTGLRTYDWLVEVMVEFYADDFSSRVPYFVGITAAYSYEERGYTWHYGGYSHRRGLLSVDGADYLIAIANLKTTGGYEDPATLVVAIDIDRDGRLNTLPFSHEVFGPGEPLALPGGTYRISSVRPDGTRLELERVGGPIPRPPIEIGLAAPPFRSTSTSGDDVGLPGDGTRVTALLFQASSIGGCTSCSDVTFSMPKRADELIKVLSGMEEEVQLIVATDLLVPDEFAVDVTLSIPVYVIPDPDVVELYRRHTGLLVIDKDGIIAGMDRPWSRFEDGRPIWTVEYLNPSDVLWIVQELLG